MKRVEFLFIYLLIAMQILTGCSSGDKQVSTEVLKNGGKSAQAINERYKDKAVVIDTVVDIFKEAKIDSERITQGLFNQPVTLIEESDGWAKVKTVDGCTGWLRSKFIDRDCTSVKEEIYSSRIVITGKTKPVFASYGGSATLKEAVMGTEFFIKGKRKNYYEVVVPGNLTGWVEMKNTIELEVNKPIPKTTAQDFSATAKKFKGTQYLMGGVSARQGIDCSGIVYICGKINGVNLPRGTMEQFDFIKDGPASVEDIKLGDLVFLSANEDLADISDIGIYLGDGQILIASEAKGSIDCTLLNSDHYMKRIRGIKRIF
ncbi:C40 family peptidase [Acetivibrio cellulolyticus]|uniref:C40 family peptidase n=1 Tax=Acetivibrio cellulolyticus TaxID=35830 RepID=UPI0001E2F5B4|nr:SH3 domain-containing C40 family peptidase [Acetivibrio cellulolyticus]